MISAVTPRDGASGRFGVLLLVAYEVSFLKNMASVLKYKKIVKFLHCQLTY